MITTAAMMPMIRPVFDEPELSLTDALVLPADAGVVVVAFEVPEPFPDEVPEPFPDDVPGEPLPVPVVALVVAVPGPVPVPVVPELVIVAGPDVVVVAVPVPFPGPNTMGTFPLGQAPSF
ncbi:MAG TPA: hypothetical protein VEP49_06405 [Acidimicrobiia bacterium]|nr:hypothetical protein [Acidimicrobiia bacterium]